MNAINAQAERAFEKLGLKCYATPEEIDQKFRRIMLKVHPDKSGRDSGREAQEYNDLRALAQKIARDPAHHLYREKARQYDETTRYKEKIEIRLHMVAILQDQIHKLACEHEPDRYEYNPAEFQKKTRDWTPQQRQDAEDAIQYGFERHQLDKALAELESMQTENARLRASLSPSIGKAMIDTAEAKLAEETKRADGLIAAAAEGMQRASAEGERANAEGERADAATKALEEERRRADAAEAELEQCKQRISEVEKCLAEADKKASEWEQRFVARCEDDGAAREKLQQANEQKILLEQKLTDAGQSVEAAEAKAKEWQNKCSALQESLDQMLADNAQSETQAETGDSHSKKRRIISTDQYSKYSELIRNFVTSHTKATGNSKTSLLSTTALYETFQKHYKDQQPEIFNYRHFAAEFSKCIQDVHPNILPSRNKNGRGYVGLVLNE